MAGQGKGSRWGSFLSQAVAGMEAHLDNMLAEGDGTPSGSRPPGSSGATTPSRQATPNNSNVQTQPASPRASSTSTRTGDRLQERLAKAVASKNTQNTPTAAEGDDGRAVTAAVEITTQPETIAAQSAASNVPIRNGSPSSTEIHVVAESSHDSPQDEGDGESGKGTNGRSHLELDAPSQPRAQVQAQSPLTTIGCQRCNAHDDQLQSLRVEHQQEILALTEQIDSLQSKLQYVSREASNAARRDAAESDPGTVAKKLAEKDEKICLLMDEGISMSAAEQKNREITRKLKSQLSSFESTTADLKSAREKTLVELDSLKVSAARCEELEQSHAELQRELSRARAELDNFRSDAAVKDGTIVELKRNVQAALDEVEAAASKSQVELLASEQRRNKELEDVVASLQVEKNLVAERAKKQAADLASKTEQAMERARMAEIELRGELQATEGKLEAMRALVEETSSGAVGDAQGKLLRQVETLQTQHAIASVNWQGIEASLVARLSNLEKERDDAQKRESDLRKRARETAVRCKRQEEDIQELRNMMSNQNQGSELEALQTQLLSSNKRAEVAETELSQIKAELEKYQALGRSDRNDHFDRRLWLEDGAASTHRSQSRPDSPLLSIPLRTHSSDLLILQGPPTKGRKVSTPGSVADSIYEQSPRRRLSSQPPARPAVLPNSAGLPSSVSTASADAPLERYPAPSSHMGDRDDVFDGIEISSSPRQIMQDMMSVSTIGAGPSVQLVERMSAAIRRLEAEKVASREELLRISSQRDEARAELTSFMKEAQSGKAAAQKVSILEAEVVDINSRYQTTLELLGEKSELVEELRADVEDVKAMYRDLIERTVKG